ncbi:MAG: response regulator transcription factor [Myxococcota bacterium]|nr:response regulator transcription factor [Myxococcota bacterium]
MMKILVIEDDLALRTSIVTTLELERFEVYSATDGEQGLERARRERFDLITLDLVLPSMTGIEICRQLRTEGITTPIIILTGERKDELDRVLGLELGADDYMLKPFSSRELVARIRAVLRRTHQVPAGRSDYTFGNIRIDFRKKIVCCGGKELHLTAKEFRLLEYFVAHEGEVISRESLLNNVWGYNNYPSTRTVDTFVHGLRRKVEREPSKPKHIVTIHWTGYKFVK